MDKAQKVRDIGSYIRRLRKEKGYTQTELAHLAGCSLMFLSALENGKHTAQIGKVLHVLQILGADVYLEQRGQS